MKPSLVVLAAGIGSRYGGLKQMDPIGPAGEFLLDYAVYDAVRAGFGRVVFVIRHDIEAPFREAIGGRIERHVPVAYAFQEVAGLPEGRAVPSGRTKPWGTGHAVLSCAGIVQEPFGVINADDFYGPESYRLLAGFLRDTASDPKQYALVAFRLDQTLSEHGSVARGVGTEAEPGWLARIEEHTGIRREGAGIVWEGGQLSGAEPVSMNMWGFKPGLLAHLKDGFSRFLDARGTELKAEYYLPEAVDRLIAAREAKVALLRTSETWFGVTHPQDKAAVVARIKGLIEGGVYPPSLWK
jgi:hypothetical protein